MSIDDGRPCINCGSRNFPVWYVRNHIWNAVMGGEVGVVCILCFERRAVVRGVKLLAWCNEEEVLDLKEQIERLEAKQP